MKFTLREMLIDDYEAVLALWSSIPGFEYRPVTDSRTGIHRFLTRNPGLSLVAIVDEEIVGCILGSHDGRRGFLQHVVVAQHVRGEGVARSMVDECLQRLRQEHLQWVLLNVSIGNDDALSFWKKAGWFERKSLLPLALELKFE